MTTTHSALLALDPCRDARDWLVETKPTSLRAAWDDCPRGDWLVWLVGRSHIHGTLTRQRLVAMTLRAIKPVCHLLTDAQVLDLGIVARWTVGEATIDAAAATATAYADATDAAYDAYAAAAAATATAYADATDAAYDAADAAYAAAATATAYADATATAYADATDAAYDAVAYAAYAAATAVAADVIRAAITADEVAAALGWDADERWDADDEETHAGCDARAVLKGKVTT